MSKQFIKELEKISLSNKDILRFIGNRANLVLYPDIRKYKTIDQLLGKHGACVILYLTKENPGLYGHWCCVFKQGKNTIQFFDPYGGPVDSQLDYSMDDYFRKKYNLDIPLLTWLLYKSKYKVRYNEFPFQEEKTNINTCGRHVCCRILLKYLDEYEYEDFMYSTQYKPDELVTLLTQDVDTEDA